MFENLSSKLQTVFKKLRGKGKLSEKDVSLALKEIKLALLEADVNYKVVKEFISSISAKALGKEILESLTPAAQVTKVVHEELINILGGSFKALEITNKPFFIKLVGLHGCGKTTTAGKLALFLKQKGHKVLLVGTDIYRPAAVEQLQALGRKIKVEVHCPKEGENPVDTLISAKKIATLNSFEVVIIDTAGRFHIDQEMMQELKLMKEESKPDEILLVVDAMTGQEAVNISNHFNQELNLTGVILTKLDGDARGGAALSINMTIKKPIKLVGIGEKLEDLEVFYPERMASRILGMGDVLSLIEKAEKIIDKKKALELENKIRKQSLDLNDFLLQIQQIKKMGSMEQIISMIPGLSHQIKNTSGLNFGEKNLNKTEAIILSMTREEREKPHIINGSRRRRIAIGSGSTPNEINNLLRQFEQMKLLTKGFHKKSNQKQMFSFLR
ncbi:signal recognition particle protein [bacterium]|nr:signal recognition particle protein [bacterium]MBU1153468.1 signal recognition particle protein [bacterium]